MSDPAQSPEARLDSLIAEYLERVEAGETVAPEDFIATAPDLRQSFLEFIETSDSIDRISDKSPAQRPDVSAVETSRSGTLDGTLDETIAPTKQTTEKIDKSGIPKEFGRYEIKKLLGEGAMGAVYQAFDTQLHRLIALKVPKISDDDPELLARFYREARTAGGIRNANICPVYDVGDIDGQHYISMAFIEGKPLSAFISPEKPIPAKSMAVIMRKLAIALHEAHSLGVIHRDLKPDNIMIDKKHEPVIMDFGLARVESSLASARMTQSGMILGTPAYMSPEQVEASLDSIGAPSDQYSMGVILYKMCAGKLPFRGSAAAVFGQIMTKEPEAPSKIREGVPPKLEAICLKMMSKNIEDRYADMQEVAQVLADFLKNPGPKNKVVKQKAKSPEADAALADEKKADPVDEALMKTVVPQTPFDPSIETLRPTSAEPKSTTKRKPKPKKDIPSQAPPWWTNRLVQLGGLGGLVLLLGIVFSITMGKHNVQITLHDSSISLSVDGVDGEALNIKDGPNTIRLRAGEHKLVLEKDGLKTHVEEFTVTKNGKTAIEVKIVNGNLDALLNGEKPATAMTADPNVADSNAPGSHQPLASTVGNGLSFDGNAMATIEDFPVNELSNCTIEFFATPSRNSVNDAENLIGINRNTAIVIPKDNKWHFSTYHEPQLQMCTVVGDRIEAGKRVHLAAVRDGKSVRLFVDGGLAWEEEFSGDLLKSGKETVQIGRLYHGVIDELRISKVARYKDAFSVPEQFKADQDTLGMYHFDEGSGNVFKDSSGNGHHGKIDGAKWVSSNSKPSVVKSAGATNGRTSRETSLYFSDPNDEVTIPTLKDDTDALTIELWLQRDSAHLTEHSLIVGFGGSTGIKTSAGTALCFSVEGGVGVDDVPQDGWDVYGIGQPIHVAGVRDPIKKEIRLYYDGKLIQRSSGELRREGGSLQICSNQYQWSGNEDHSFSGWIDEVRISKSVRYKEDFKPERRFEGDAETAALYHFDEGSGDVLNRKERGRSSIIDSGSSVVMMFVCHDALESAPPVSASTS